MINRFSFLILLFFLCSISGFSQVLEGDWHSVLKSGSRAVRLDFHFKREGSGWKGSMDSPDQGVKDIACDEVLWRDSSLEISIKSANIRLKLAYRDPAWVGKYYQGGFSADIQLVRELLRKVSKSRPQDPKPPFPYRTEEKVFRNAKAGIQLSGTLSLPQNPGRYPVVLFISGSGAQDRDEEIFGHKPFWILADTLARAGVASFRYDDRGTAASEGQFVGATSRDFYEDALAAVAMLRQEKEVDPSKILVLGHSEGGLIAAMLAAELPDLGGIVLMAGPGLTGDEVLRTQIERISFLMGLPAANIKKADEMNKKLMAVCRSEQDSLTCLQNMRAILQEANQNERKEEEKMTAEKIDETVLPMLDPWMRYFIRSDVSEYLRKVHCPVLAVNGDLDCQVLAQPNLKGIRNALLEAKNRDYEIVKLKGLNHLFQSCNTGLASEYGSLSQSLDPRFTALVVKWIISHTRP